MKMLMVLVLASMIVFGNVVFGQNTENSVADMKAQMAALQVKLAEQQKTEGSLSSRFAGFGKELGTAFNGFIEAMDGGMKVTTTRVNEFAQTDVGKFAMIGIGWKIFANDIIYIVKSACNKTVGFIFLLVFCWLLKRTVETICWGRMIVTKREGPWFRKSITKERTTALINAQIKNSETGVYFLVVSAIALIAMFLAACVGLTH